MKRILALTTALAIITLTVSACTSSETPPKGEIKSISMTIAETLPSCLAFEEDCFYAYDTDEKFYRVLWADHEGLEEKDQITVEYDSIKELTYDEYPDGGYTPEYEITAISVKLHHRSEANSCLEQENGIYTLTLPESGKTIELDDDEAYFAPYITDELVKSAERKLSGTIAEYTNNSGFYLQADNEGYLCLAVEIIKKIDPPHTSGDDGEYAEDGCGIDHEHMCFFERISDQPR